MERNKIFNRPISQLINKLTKVCLTIPKKIISIKDKMAKVDTGVVDVSIINNPRAGDWVLVNANLAVQKVSQSEAKKILSLIK